MKSKLFLSLAIAVIAAPLFGANVSTNPLSGAKAFPNPWRVDKHANSSVTFDGMPGGSKIKIFTISAHLVKELTADSSGIATWDRMNNSGQSVASGIYIYLIIDPQGNDTTGKIAIIK